MPDTIRVPSGEKFARTAAAGSDAMRGPSRRCRLTPSSPATSTRLPSALISANFAAVA
jgi:hypothetical protein